MTGMKMILAGILLASGLLSTRAAAQGTYRPQVYNPNIYSRTRQTMSDRAAARAALERKRRSAGGLGAGTSPSSPAPAKNPPPVAGTVTFRQVEPSIAPRQMALKLGDTPAEQRRIEALFSEALESYLSRLKQAGLPTNDVARAAAYLVTASYHVANDGHVSLDDAQLDALRRHMRELFSTEETFQRLSDRERQELFEDYGITATWIDAGFNIVKAAGDHKGMRQWREMARQNFINILGAPPERVVFTARGVEYK